jgi:thioredoxin-related protein
MLRSILTFPILLFLFSLKAQETEEHVSEHGIHFQPDLSWQQVKEKAALEHKFIFIDFYTTWCGPCKFMSDSIFTQTEVGDFMNAHFVCIKLQMNSTSTTMRESRHWQPEKANFLTLFNIVAYPTFLIFDTDGTPLHRIVGGSTLAKSFIDSISKSFDPNTQFFTIERTYFDRLNNHKSDSLYLSIQIDSALAHQEYAKASNVLNYFIRSIKDPFAKPNLKTILNGTYFIKDSGFKFLTAKYDSVVKLTNKYDLDHMLKDIISKDRIEPLLSNDTLDWAALLSNLRKSYPRYADFAVAEKKTDYFYMRGKTREYEDATIYYLDHYKNQLINFWVNWNCWQLFLTSNRKNILSKAAYFSKSLIEKEIKEGRPSPNDVDTYANLLYKLGDKRSSIEWERKAIRFANGDPEKVTELMSTFQKMQNGEKTWQ